MKKAAIYILIALASAALSYAIVRGRVVNEIRAHVEPLERRVRALETGAGPRVDVQVVYEDGSVSYKLPGRGEMHHAYGMKLGRVFVSDDGVLIEVLGEAGE